MQDHVILVDEHDNQIGTEEKIEAHRQAKLHRAFSIFIFNEQEQIMMQQRAFSKYHSGGLWTNTVCSHPRPGETTDAAAHRRLQEEMGFDCDLEEKFSFIYKVALDKGLSEHEFDHVFVGKYNDEPILNREEAESFAWMSVPELKEDIKNHPEKYTEWLKIIFAQYLKKMNV